MIMRPHYQGLPNLGPCSTAWDPNTSGEFAPVESDRARRVTAPPRRTCQPPGAPSQSAVWNQSAAV